MSTAPKNAPKADTINITKSEFRARAEAQYADILNEIATDPLLKRQFELEVGMIEDGSRKFWESQQRVRPHTDKATGGVTVGHESQTMAGSKLVRNAIAAVAARVAEFIAIADTGKPGKRHASVKFLRLLKPEEIAAISLRQGMDSAAINTKHTAAAATIGRALDEEMRIREVEKLAPDLINRIERGFRTSNTTHRRRVYAACIHRAGLEEHLRPKMSSKEAQVIGTVLIHLMVESTGLFTIRQDDAPGNGRPKNHSTPNLFSLADSAFEWIAEHDARAQYSMPVWLPTVVPPRPWRSFRSGGYHYTMAGRIPLVRDAYYKKPHAYVTPKSCPSVFGAINAVQATRWQVNGDVLSIMRQAAMEGSAIGELPAREAQEPIAAPTGIPMEREQRTEEQNAQLREWKERTRAVHSENKRLASHKGVLSRALLVADQFAEDKAIYFPHFLDFRGRMYPASLGLSPQGHEWQRALLRFADAIPLGPQGATWLAIHGCNCMGDDPETGAKLDKTPLQSRVDWVTAHGDLINKSARSPWQHDWWQKAKAPWQFLAFCFEWAGVLEEWEFNGKPDAYRSRLPVSMDGSCNGLQHFSAMLRDEVGGHATNLVPLETPSDIYMQVQQLCMAVVVEDAKRGKPEAQYWLDNGQFDRGLVKRPVMTMPYGSKRFGITDQLREELKKRGVDVSGELAFSAMVYLAGIISEKLSEVVVKAAEIMNWLQGVARDYALADKPMFWTLPTGFVVCHDYRKSKMFQVKTRTFGKIVSAGYSKSHEPGIDARSSCNAVSPNFVHSYDAAALVLYINEASSMGIASFSCVHDSFGTHAARAWDMYVSIRSSFVSMYEQSDAVEALLQEVSASLGPDLSNKHRALAPLAGSLDLIGVLDSDFFFS